MQKNPMEAIEMPRIEKRLPSSLTKQDALKLLEVIYNYPYDYKYLRYRNHARLCAERILIKSEPLLKVLPRVFYRKRETRLCSHSYVSVV